MSIRILTKTGEQITHIDDARAYNFDAGNKSGIVKGVFNEGNFNSNASNSIYLDSCELRIAGHRVVIDSAESIALNNAPSTNTRYSMIAEIMVDTSSVPTFRLFIQQSTTTLRQDNLYKTEVGSGIYQLEIGRFTLTTDGQIKDIVRTADLITGMSYNENQYWEVGNITANMIDSELPANVDIDFNEDTKKYDFNFDIPKSSGSSNVIANNGEEVTEELNTLMINDKNYGVPKPVKYLQTLPDPTPDSPELVNLMNTDSTDALYRKQGYFQGFNGSDLTNTTWILAKNHGKLTSKEINFTCKEYPGITYKEIWSGPQDNTTADYGYRLYWTNESGSTSYVDTYESITITIYSGSDVANSILIEWIQGNATFIPEIQYKYIKIQDELTYKTINGQSIIGEGNIIIQGGDGSGGANITQEVLWTNPNPNQSFVEQDINVNGNLSDYDLLLFTQRISNSDVNYFTGFTDITNFKTLGKFIIHSEFANKWGRYYKYKNESTIHIFDGHYNGKEDSKYGIPVNIIGFKFQTNDYSTEEQYTGKHWVDGKKIYQRTIELNLSVAATNWYDTNIQIPNIETITHSDVLGIDNGYTSSTCHFGAALVTYRANGYLIIHNAGVVGIFKHVILQYTKTTE